MKQEMTQLPSLSYAYHIYATLVLISYSVYIY